MAIRPWRGRPAEEAVFCDLCPRRALFRSYTPQGSQIAACREHRAHATDAMRHLTVQWDTRHLAARLAKRRLNGAVEPAYNVSKKPERKG